MSEKLRIIFYGTPDFAVASLDAILKANFEVLAVVTAPDRKSGRGMKLTPSAVKKFALAENLPVLQPRNLKSEEFQEQLKEYNPNIQVVIAFRMMPEKVWNFPKFGTINLHGSYLPNYRGAAPINWAIINGDQFTGVSTFRLKHEIDTGNLLKQAKVDIEPDDNMGSMHDKLMIIGAHLMVETLMEIQEGTSKEYPQDHSSEHNHAPKIFKEDCIINWEQSAENIHNLIRGLSPYPVARTSLNNKTFKVFRSKIIDANSQDKPGKLITDNKSYIQVNTADKIIELLEVQLEGKKRMKVDEFLRGYELDNAIQLS